MDPEFHRWFVQTVCPVALLIGVILLGLVIRAVAEHVERAEAEAHSRRSHYPYNDGSH